MTQPDISLSTAEVRAHAGMVDEAAVMCQEAVGGAEYVDLHDEAYGEWCSRIFLPIIQPVQDWAVREIRSGADATAHLADLLRTLAHNVDVTDAGAAARIRDSGR